MQFFNVQHSQIPLKSLVGASLLAIAVGQAASFFSDRPPSRAGSLPQLNSVQPSSTEIHLDHPLIGLHLLQ
ncbi:hypothetical protein EKG40_11975 [Pseudomonas moorei]|nr:hypothetical protein EKG40_11975 [Pseudomonas moorei]